MTSLTGFKAYDIRGRLGDELNEAIAYRIGRACGQFLRPSTMVVGSDVRPTSAGLKAALSDGLRDCGADVLDIGMVGTEEVYHGTRHLQADGGVIVTASHNPIDYNGMKLVRREARPISADTGLKEIQALAEADSSPPVEGGRRGGLRQVSTRKAYVDHLLTYIDPGAIKPLRLVVNPGNGNAGPVIDALEERLAALDVPLEFIRVHHQPDGSFPNGIPNPLLPENRPATAGPVKATGADMGIAWDGDFDRCFLFDEKGSFIEGYYLVGLLAEAFLRRHPGARIVHDPRLTWNTLELVNQGGGVAVQSKSGHAFIKERMRQEDAVYGGEMSAHHYFRDFGYCDSGMIPWLLVAEMMSRKDQPLSRLMAARMQAYPVSGEINTSLEDPQAVMEKVRSVYEGQAVKVDTVDGLSMEMADWRFNLRCSNTEPLIRLNVESRGDAGLMKSRTEEILELMKS